MMISLKDIKNCTYVLIVGSLAFCTFFWYLSPSGKHHGSSIILEGSTGIWRWECTTSNTCHRVAWKFGESGQSFRTCQMTCGPVPIWPLPNGEVIMSKQSVMFSYKNIKIKPIISSNAPHISNILSTATQLFLNDINPDISDINVYQPVKKSLQISIIIFGNFSDLTFTLGVDESYKLVINEENKYTSVIIKSLTFFGARHALETLRQLIWYDEVNNVMRILSHVKIFDSPSFTYRGLLLDTANNFITLDAIKRTIKTMAAVKMNVFHWHITGATSFPFLSKNREHAIYGAYSSNKIYSKNDVLDVIQFAKLRGIKVLLELDNPGNISQGWSWGPRKRYGNLNMCHKNKYGSCQDTINCSHINPNNEKSYSLLKDLLEEFSLMVGPSDIFHLGGNINMQCWSKAEEVTDMYQNKQEDISGVLNYHQHVLDFVTKINGNTVPNIILWSDYLKTINDQSTTIDSRMYIAQVNSESNMEDEKTLINKGYRVIISHQDKWDLSKFPHWKVAYNHRPWEQFLWSQREQVLGGEALLWSDHTDQHTLDGTLWPNTAAVAEILWTDPQVEPLFGLPMRLQVLRDRLIDRGIRCGVIEPKWCIQNPGECF